MLLNLVRVLGLRLELHEVDDIDHPDFQLGQMLAHNGDGGERLQRGHVATAGHDHVGRNALVVAGPLPDADTLGAVLAFGCLFRNDLKLYVYPLLEAETVPSSPRGFRVAPNLRHLHAYLLENRFIEGLRDYDERLAPHFFAGNPRQNSLRRRDLGSRRAAPGGRDHPRAEIVWLQGSGLM